MLVDDLREKVVVGVTFDVVVVTGVVVIGVGAEEEVRALALVDAALNGQQGVSCPW